MLNFNKLTYVTTHPTEWDTKIEAGVDLRANITFHGQDLTPDLTTFIGQELRRCVWKEVYREPLDALCLALRNLREQSQSASESMRIEKELGPLFELLKSP